MANLVDQKLSAGDFAGKNISALPDKPTLTAAQLKARFDDVVEDIVTPKYNAAIDILLGTTSLSSGAEQIGSAAIAGVTGATVHGQLVDLKNQFDNVLLDPRVFPDDSITTAKIQDNAVTTGKIIDKAVTLSKMADMATSSLIYRKTASSGAPEVNTLATLKADLGTMPPDAHNQDASTINSGAFDEARIPTLAQTKVTGLPTIQKTIDQFDATLDAANQFTITDTSITTYTATAIDRLVYFANAATAPTVRVGALAYLALYQYGTTPLEIKAGGQWVRIVKVAAGTSFFGVSAGGIALPTTIAAGTTVVNVDLVQKNEGSATYYLKRTVVIKIAGAYRFRYELHPTVNGSAVYVKLQNNLVDVPTSEYTISDSAGAFKTIDVTVAANDSITLWLKGAGAGVYGVNNALIISMLWADLATEIAKII